MSLEEKKIKNVNEILDEIKSRLRKEVEWKIESGKEDIKRYKEELKGEIEPFSAHNKAGITIKIDDDGDVIYDVNSSHESEGMWGGYSSAKTSIYIQDCIPKEKEEKIKSDLRKIKDIMEEKANEQGISWKVNIHINPASVMNSCQKLLGKRSVYSSEDLDAKMKEMKIANPLELVGMFTDNFKGEKEEEEEEKGIPFPEDVDFDTGFEIVSSEIDRRNREGKDHIWHSDVAIIKHDSEYDKKGTLIHSSQFYHPYEDV